jgi:predicted nucleic acid-binding protein
MKIAYLDTSLLIRLKFETPAKKEIRKVQQYEALFSSELLYAEAMAFGCREKLDTSYILKAIEGISWILPDRSIAEEIQEVISCGYIRGADLWHLACARYFSPDPAQISFLTRDASQREIAAELGFDAPVFE